MNTSLFHSSLSSHMDLFNALPALEPNIAATLGILREALLRGNKILVAGNGGSAADAQHFTGELVGRFQRDRRALPCLALNTNTSNLTAIGNDLALTKFLPGKLKDSAARAMCFLVFPLPAIPPISSKPWKRPILLTYSQWASWAGTAAHSKP